MLSIKTRQKILETFIELVVPYDLSTVIYRRVDDSILKAVQNVARRIMLGLCNRRQISIKFLAEKDPARNNYRDKDPIYG